MAVIERNGGLFIYFRPFLKEKIGIRMPDGIGKKEAKRIEAQVLYACRTGSYGSLDPVCREVCIRMFQNRSWEPPAELGGRVLPQEELTLWRAVQLCLTSPEVKDSPNRERHEQAFVHIVEHFTKGFDVKALQIPQVREYQTARLKAGAAASTVNKERAALSKMFQALIEMNLIDRNPVSMVKGPSERDGRREVYISLEDFSLVVKHLPGWVRPIIQTLYMTGMRRGEALGLTWWNVDLESRIIRVHSMDAKERHSKRIPIHQQLLPILEAASMDGSLKTGPVFLSPRGRRPADDSLKNPWLTACTLAGLDPIPTIHDLRHCWKTNAMRSGMDFEIREAILGHYRGIAGRYGRISDEDLVKAIDGMTFDHGKTEVWVARELKNKTRKARLPGKKGNSKVTEPLSQKVMSTGRLS